MFTRDNLIQKNGSQCYMYRHYLVFLIGFIFNTEIYAQAISRNDSLLIAAVTENNLPLTESLIQKGGNVNLQDPSGLSLMHIAAKENFSDLLTLLIRKGANMDITSHYGNTPLELAVYTGSDLCAYLLINSGANINAHGSKDGGTPIQYAVIKTQPALFMHLLRKGADLTIQNKAGYNVIHQIANSETFLEALQTVLNSPYSPKKFENLFDYGDPLAILDTLAAHGAAFFYRDTLGYKPLHFACKKNNKILIQYLLHRKDNINDQENTKKETPLICAIQNNHESLALYLIQRGADIEAAQHEKWTALHYSARDGYHKAALKILKRKNVINAQNIRGWTPLHLAAWNNQVLLVNLLLLNGAKDSILNEDGKKPSDLAKQKKLDELATQIQSGTTNLVELYNAGLVSVVDEQVKNAPQKSVSSKDSKERTLLHVATTQNDIPFIKMLIENGADVNATDAEGRTALMYCIELALYEKLLKLLIQKSNVNTKDHYGNTALHYGAAKEDTTLLKILLKRGADPNLCNHDDFTPFETACSKTGDTDIMKLFLVNGATINPKRRSNFSPLMLCLGEKNYATSLLLLQQGADINYHTENGLTPLHIITAKSFGKFLSLALDHDADVNVKTIDSLFTPLHFAAENGNVGTVKVLYWHEADLNAKNILGQTALDMATIKGNAEVIQFLAHPTLNAMELMDFEEEEILVKYIGIGTVTDLQQKDENGLSLLHRSVLADSRKLAEALLGKGFNINEKDLSGNTPLLFAIKTCNSYFAEWLIQKGANPNLPDLRGETPYAVCIRRDYQNLKNLLEILKAHTLIDIKKEPALISPNITSGEIFVARYAPDGKTMLSAGENNLVLWDTKTARIIKVFENISKSISDIAFSPDGKLAAIAEGRAPSISLISKWDNDWQNIALWDMQTCRFLKKIKLEDGIFLQSVVFSKNGKQLLVTAVFGGIQVYDVATGKRVSQCGNREIDYPNALWMPGEKEILAVTGKRLEWWNPAKKQLIKQQGFPHKINKVILTSDGKFAIIGHEKGMLLFDLNTWKTVKEYDCNNKNVHDISASPDNRYVAAAYGDFLYNYVRLFQLENATAVNEFIEHKRFITSVCFSPDSKFLLGTDAGAQLLEWPVKNSNDFSVPAQGKEIITLSADEQFLFTAGKNKPLCKRSAKDLRLLEKYDTVNLDLFKMSLNTAADRCFLISRTGGVLEYDIRQKNFLPSIVLDDFSVRAAFPMNDTLLILVSNKAEILYWHLQKRKIILRYGKDDSATIIHAQLSPDKKRIALAGNCIRMADLENGRIIALPAFKLPASGYVTEVSFLNDPNFLLASISWSGLATIALPTGKIVRLFNPEISHSNHKITTDRNFVISRGLMLGGSSYSMINFESGESVYKTAVLDESAHPFFVLSSSGNLFISSDVGIHKKHPYPDQVSRIFTYHQAGLNISGLSPDASFITIMQDSSHYTIDLKTFKKEKMVPENGTGFKKVNTITPYGDIEIYTQQEEIHHWNFKDVEITKKISGSKYPLSSSIISRDGKLIATGDHSGTIRIKNHALDTLIRLINLDQTPSSLALSSDNKILYVASNNYFDLLTKKSSKAKNLLTAWSVETGKRLNQLDTFMTKSSVIQIIRSDSMLISYENLPGEKISRIKLHRLKENYLTDLLRYDGQITGISISHDERKMLINQSSGGLIVYDLDSLNEINISAHASPLVASAFTPDDKYIYSAATDNSIKIWDATTTKLVSTIFIASDSTRMIIGPDNYYACSKEIIKDFGWQVDNRRFEFDQFDLAYNRPELAYKSLPYTDTSVLPLYYKAWKKRLEKMNFTEEMLSGEFHVPEIMVTNKEMLPYKTNSGNITLQISGSDSKYTINRLNTWINGVPLFGVKGITVQSEAGKAIIKNIPIKLSQGLNKIEISVTNEKGTESLKETILLQFNPPEKRKPDLYIVTIGASEYQDTTMNLVYAAKDATDIRILFNRKTDLYNSVHSFTLLNREVSKENILKIKNSLLLSQPDDVVVIFYAGHGLLDKKLDYYLASFAMDFYNPSQNGIPYEMLESLVDSIPARNKLILLDACFSGEVDKTDEPITSQGENNDGKVKIRVVGNTRGIGLKQPLRQKEAFDLMKLQFTDIRRSTGALVISSAGGAEFAFEGDSWKNGVFTYSLLDGLLSGKADVLPTNTGITANELSSYLMERVKGLTQGRQTPTNRREKIEFDFRIW